MTEFTKGPECIEYCNTHSLSYYRRDLNQSFAKVYVADTHQNIFQKIKSSNTPLSYYESWITNQPLKLYIDYEKKVNTENNDPTPAPANAGVAGIDTNVASGSQHSDLKKKLLKINEDEKDVSHKHDILNIINCVTQLLPNITGSYILKSYPDKEKKSYHIIFDGIYFPNYRIIKLFIEEQLKPKFKELFEKKIIDVTVYAPKCFRSLLCSKYGQNRPLYLLDTNAFKTHLDEIKISKQETTFDMFKKTCITYIEGNSILQNYKSIEKKKDNQNKKLHLINDGDIYSDKDIVKKYLDLLDADRYTDRNKWLNIGYILYSLSPDYSDLWHYFSSKWENYSEKDVIIAWDSFNNNEYIYTIHNLIYLARIDNLNDYNELANEIPNHDIKYIRPFDNIISKVIYRLYGERFVCSNPEKNEWYYFNNIRWMKENKSHQLRKLMINDVFSRVEKYRKQLINEGASEELVKNYHSILKILGSGNKLNCLELEFYNANFIKIIDQNRDLLGFENGVYDLIKMEFRKGEPSDYISMSTGYEFIEYSESSKEYRELHELLCKILPIKDTRDFTLKSLSSCLDAHTRDENFYIWSGKSATGGNGKSTLLDLLLKSLGDYGVTAPVTLLTGKRENASGANSALMSIINKRAVICQEPEADEQIQASNLKSFTGGDTISARDLHASQTEFKLHSKFFLSTNRIPLLSGSDGGTSRRLKITEFVSTFIDKPSLSDGTINETTGVFEFKIDKELKSKLDGYKPVFMSILLHYYRLYKTEGLRPPFDVIKVTKKYEADNDIMQSFIEENIQKGSKNDFITKEELKTLYKNDFVLKSSFNKFNIFLGRLEIALLSEFKLDKKRISKLYGYTIKQPMMESDDETHNV